MKKRVLALVLAMLFVMGMLAACTPATTDPGTNDPGTTDPNPGTTTTDPVTTDPGTQDPGTVEPTTGVKVYRDYMSGDIKTLNAHNSVDSAVQTPYDYCSSTLFRTYHDEDGKGFHYIPDIASELPIQIDDYTWQIKIREDAKWHNGDPINADTFIYSWQMLINPQMTNAMGNFLCDQAITIVGATEYYRQVADGTTHTWDEVGIKKIDDYTIEIQTVNASSQREVCSHFTDRSVFPVYQPYYDAGMNDSGTSTTFGTTLDQWMGCGPYFFDTWNIDNLHVYTKNPDHWLADLYHFERVEIRIIEETPPRVEMWEAGMLDVLSLNSSIIDQYIDDPRTVSNPAYMVLHIDINCKNPDNPVSGSNNYRKAIYHAINRDVICDSIYGGTYLPTGTYISLRAGTTSAEGLAYRESTYGQEVTAQVAATSAAGYSTGYNPELALDYMKAAFAEIGRAETDPINVIYIYNDGDTDNRAMAEYLQQEFATIFQGMVNLEPVAYPGAMSTSDYKATGDEKWDLAMNDWSRTASGARPYQAYYYFLSSYESHPNNYFNDEFEAQFAVCDSIYGDYDKLLQETKKLEEIALDCVIQVPYAQQLSYTMYSERLHLPVDEYILGYGFGTMYADIDAMEIE